MIVLGTVFFLNALLPCTLELARFSKQKLNSPNFPPGGNSCLKKTRIVYSNKCSKPLVSSLLSFWDRRRGLWIVWWGSAASWETLMANIVDSIKGRFHGEMVANPAIHGWVLNLYRGRRALSPAGLRLFSKRFRAHQTISRAASSACGGGRQARPFVFAGDQKHPAASGRGRNRGCV